MTLIKMSFALPHLIVCGASSFQPLAHCLMKLIQSELKKTNNSEAIIGTCAVFKHFDIQSFLTYF